MEITKLLNDKRVIERYKEIDRLNQFPFNHGLKHIKNTLRIADNIAKIFNLNKREVEILKTCEILHDIGQVEGREDHNIKSAEMAREILIDYPFSEEEVSIILSAIETHNEKSDYSKLKTNFSWFVNFIDKMDFAKDRLENDAKERFGYIPYEDIENVVIKKTNATLTVKIIKTKTRALTIDSLLAEPLFFNKVINIINSFSSKFNLKPEFMLENQNILIYK